MKKNYNPARSLTILYTQLINLRLYTHGHAKGIPSQPMKLTYTIHPWTRYTEYAFNAYIQIALNFTFTEL